MKRLIYKIIFIFVHLDRTTDKLYCACAIYFMFDCALLGMIIRTLLAKLLHVASMPPILRILIMSVFHDFTKNFYLLVTICILVMLCVIVAIIFKRKEKDVDIYFEEVDKRKRNRWVIEGYLSPIVLITILFLVQIF